MYGESLTMVAQPCPRCKKQQVFFLDLEDWHRAQTTDRGKTAIEIFVDRSGEPYLTEWEAELTITGLCQQCWEKLEQGEAEVLARKQPTQWVN